MRGQRSSSAQGFTLLETLVALFILSLLSVAGTGLLLGALRTGNQVDHRQAEAEQLDLAQTFIRNDLAAISVRGVRPDDGFRPPRSLTAGTVGDAEPFLQFVRSGWMNPGSVQPRSTLQAVDYRIEEGQLIRRAALRPDMVDATPQVEQVLLEGVRSATLRFFRGEDWSDVWEGDAGLALDVLPKLVEITVTFETDAELRIVALMGGPG